jgi:hypothetical protein
MFKLTDILDKMLVEFGEGYTEFIVSPNNFDKLSEELNEVIPMEELEYKGLKIVKMDGIEENKIHIR